MQLTFLQADRPLIKRYTKRDDGSFKKESYTDAWQFSSSVEDVSTLQDFHRVLLEHAQQGHCLHTGSLAKILENERRKGLHDKDEKRAWIVIDLDELKGFDTAEAVIAALPPAFHDVSYIQQHSAGSGLKPGLNMHLFFLLDREEHMKDIKNWLMHINLVTEQLRDKVTLTAKDYGLSYPLDRIANDNGRIVYIAPPECVGFEDPIAERITLVEKRHSELRFSFASSTVSDVKLEERKLIAELRKAKGLETSRTKDFYEQRNDVEVLKKTLTEPGRIHPVQKDNEFIVRCNLDDGDSEAYFYYVKHPQLLRNHKGEPCLYMEKVDPEYYNKVALPDAKQEWEKDTQPFVFRNSFDDKWYIGLRIGDTIVEQPNPIGSEKKIADYYQQHGGMGVPDPIPSWTLEFNPTLEKQWNPTDRVFNTWRPTEIMESATYRTLSPPVITKVITHVVGGEAAADEFWHFINWLAYVYQNRTKTGTAWIFHGVQGTGKGLLVDHILTPILGHDYVAKQQSRNLRAEFNGWMEQAIIVNLDEFDIHDAGKEATQVMQALKMWITDTRLPIRAMHKESRMTRNFSNFIMTTNSKSAMYVDEGDRRFNFGLRQEERLEITPDEVDEIQNELVSFAGYLKTFEVDKQKAHLCIENEAKRQAKELSRNTTEEFVDAFADGDLEYFITGQHEHARDPVLSGAYKGLVARWQKEALEDGESCVEAHELANAYRLLCNENIKIEKLKKLMAHKAMPAKQLRRPGGTRYRGWKIKWNIDRDLLVDLGGHIQPVKTQEETEEAIRDGKA